MFINFFKIMDWLSPSLGGGGGGDMTSTSTSEPWSGLQPYLTDYLSRSQTASNNTYPFYGGDTVAGFSPEQQLAFGQTTQRALAGSPTLNAANQTATKTLNGDYLNPDSNPYLKQTVNQALGDVQSRVNSQFNNNNFGTTAHQETLTRDLGNQANNLYGANYANERGLMNSALGSAIPLASSDYLDAQALGSVGQERQNLSQNYLNQIQNQTQGYGQWPYTKLNNYGNAVTGVNGGGTTTTTQPNPNQSSGFANLLGTGLTAAGLFSGGGFGGIGGLLGGGGNASSGISLAGMMPW